MSWVGLKAFQGFLVGGACVCVLVCGIVSFLSLECNEVSSSEFWGVYCLNMALRSLSFSFQGCVPVLLENYHGVACTGYCWLLA